MGAGQAPAEAQGCGIEGLGKESESPGKVPGLNAEGTTSFLKCPRADGHVSLEQQAQTLGSVPLREVEAVTRAPGPAGPFLNISSLIPPSPSYTRQGGDF